MAASAGPASARRSPAPLPRHTPQAILPRLRKLDAGFRGKWLALMLLGAAVSLVGPAIVAAIMRMREFRGGGVGIGDEERTWLWHFAVACAWLLPLLFLLEWLTRGFADRMFEDTRDDDPDWAGRVVGGALIIDVCLWGPRMVTGGVRRQVGLSRHRRADRTLAAAMLAELLNRGHAVPTPELLLLAKGRDEAFAAALAYLMFHDLVGVSKNGDRAWLLSEGKRMLGV